MTAAICIAIILAACIFGAGLGLGAILHHTNPSDEIVQRQRSRIPVVPVRGQIVDIDA